MTTPRMEEMVEEMMVKLRRDEWNKKIVTEALTEAHQAGIDEAVEVVKKQRKKLGKHGKHDDHWTHCGYCGQRKALNDTIKALQDKK